MLRVWWSPNFIQWCMEQCILILFSPVLLFRFASSGFVESAVRTRIGSGHPAVRLVAGILLLSRSRHGQVRPPLRRHRREKQGSTLHALKQFQRAERSLILSDKLASSSRNEIPACRYYSISCHRQNNNKKTGL